MIGSLKKKSISLLLAVIMFFSMMAEPLTAVAETYDYQSIYRDGGKIRSALLHGEEKYSIYAKEGAQSYQWQILIPSTEQYVSIYDMTGETCELSYALVGNMLDAAGETKIRCLLGMENGTVTAGPLRVRYTEEEKAITATPSVPEEPAEEAGFVVEAEMVAEPDAEPVLEICEITEEEPEAFFIESGETEMLGLVATPSVVEKDDAEGIPEIVEEVKEVREPVSVKAEANMTRALGDAGPGLTTTCTVTVKYLRYDEAPSQTSSISIPYIAVVPKGSVMSTTLTSPIRTGYTPYLAAEADWNAGTGKWVIDRTTATPGSSLSINISSVQQDATYYVIYMPDDATYHIRRLVQDIYTDEYNVYDSIQKTGEIGSRVPAEADKAGLEITGFTQLIYDGALVAGDNTTEVDIYYDRNYYLINFELGGGYGTNPIYARYETEVKATDPERSGYVFDGWEVLNARLNEESEPLTLSPEETSSLEVLSSQTSICVPAYNVEYRAKWLTKQTSYTVVYWRENADDNGYSYWGSKKVNARNSGYELVAGVDILDDISGSVPGVTESEIKYFTYNQELTETENAGLTVNGDGSTVANIYYTRNRYTVNFMGVAAEGYGCILHENPSDCTAACTVEDPFFEANHVNHTKECVIITYRGNRVPIGDEKTWTEIYNDSIDNSAHYYTISSIGASGDGYEIRVGYYDSIGGSRKYLIRIRTTVDGSTVSKYYMLLSTPYSGTTVELNCNKEFTNVYSITAKYQQNIQDVWPLIGIINQRDNIYKTDGVASNREGNIFCSWDNITGTETNASQRITMVERFCNTSSGGNNTTTVYAVYGYNPYSIELNYVFESKDQHTVIPESTNQRRKPGETIKYSGSTKVTEKYYDKSLKFSENIRNTAGITNKAITGMNIVGYTTEYNTSAHSITEYLYYDYKRFDIKYTNVNKTVLTVSDVWYDTPLSEIRYIQGQETCEFTQDYTADYNGYISEFIPEYPETYEPNAYDFEGWYTTPDCLDGTEADFSAHMPDSDIMYYAKWVPKIHQVRVFNTYDDLISGADDRILQEVSVFHGSVLPSAVLDDSVRHPVYVDEEQVTYTFEGWFFFDEQGNKTAFKFDNMPVNGDLDLFAEWKSNELIRYTIHYTYVDNYGKEFEVAEPTTGTIIAGMTKTFSAKAIPQLYDRYQTHYFPESSDQSIMFTKETYPEGTAEYTFYYRYLPYVNYTVQYLDAITGDPITSLGIEVGYPGTAEVEEDRLEEDASIILRTDRAITTERFAQVAGFLPDEYQKKIILTADSSKNVIQFYYTADEENGLYYVSHLVKTTNAAGTVEWMEKSYKRGSAANGTVITESALSIAGYQYEARPVEFVREEGGTYRAYHVTYATNPVTGKAEPVSVPAGADENVIIDLFDPEDPGYGTVSGTVQSGSVLILRFYYELEKYPYTIYHRINNTSGENLMWEENGEAEYGTYFTGYALDFSDPAAPHYKDIYNGYHLQAGSPEIKTQRITSTESLNVITFYYDDTDVELRYVEVYTDGSTRDIGAGTGYVTQTLQVLGVHSGANPIGSTAVNTSEHYCAGWFTDEACTRPVNSSWVTTDGNGYKVIVPQPGGCLKENATYYALFKPTSAHLRINKTVSLSDLQEAGDGTFVFHIEGPGSSGQVELDVTLTVDSTTGTGTVLVTDLPLGSLTVTEDTGWSWRYSAQSTNSAIVDLVTPGAEHEISFTNTLEQDKWLDVSDFRRNSFK